MSRAPVGSPTGAAAALVPVVSTVVERHGFVLDDLDVRPAGRRRVVRVTVDTTDAPGVDDGPAAGVDLDAVAAISRDVSAAVDTHEQDAGAVLDGAYTLEVTTPGTDRPLTEPRHWRRAWLRTVAVTLTGGGSVTGRVGAVGDTAVTLAVGGGLRRLGFDEIERAGIEVEFKPAPEAEVEMLRDDRRGDASAVPGRDEEAGA